MSHTTKYFNSLTIEGNKVISYTTHVATIVGKELHVHGYWSRTTSKHINQWLDGVNAIEVPQDDLSRMVD